MAKRYNLNADNRTVVGKQVKQLRRNGLIPAVVYGNDVDAVAVAVAAADFAATHRQAGETGLIDLQVSGETASRPVLIHDMLVDPVSSSLLHVDFYQVNLKEKLIAAVPLEFVGEAPIVKTNDGILLELLHEVEVESLPAEIPSSIEVDISILTEMDQGILVKDLPLPAGVEMKTDPEELVCKIDAAQMSEEEVEEQATPESEEEGTAENATESEDNSGQE